jgi:aryl-alcohol dehydrogenase-like predicted oxidoreductase
MNFGERTPEADATRIVDRAIEHGIRFFDTANMYYDGAAEAILGRALGKRRESCFIASKVGLQRLSGKVEGLGAARVLAACDESLKRLQTTYLDLYYFHAPDHATDIAESMGAMATLIANGKVRAWGLSNYASWQILDVFHRADARGMPRPVVSQQMYNLLVRQLDIEYFRFARTFPGVHTTVYNPLAGGLLTARHLESKAAQEHAGDGAKGRAPAPGSRFATNRIYQKRYWTPRLFAEAEAYAEVARRAGLSLVELAYGFVASTAEVDSVLVGPATVAHLDEARRAIGRPLEPAVVAEIDALRQTFAGTDATYAR